MLDDLIDEYVATLDDTLYHPFLEAFYSQLGNLSFTMYKKEKALEAYRNCLKCKEIIYPKDSQELIRPLMQILRLSSENDESLEPVEVG